MILQALSEYYEGRVDLPNSGLPPIGFSNEPVHFALVINEGGELIQVLDLREDGGKKLRPRILRVPQPVMRSSNVMANFLRDNTKYVLGAEGKTRPKGAPRHHAAFRALHNDLLSGCTDRAAIAVLSFLNLWDPSLAPDLEYWQEMQASNLVFILDGDNEFVHEKAALVNVWLQYFHTSFGDSQGTCLVSGARAPIMELHYPIKGVYGTRSGGSALVAFNQDSFRSYGKVKGDNAPISVGKASAYQKSLNYFLRSSRNRVLIGDTTTVFWARRDTPVEGFFGSTMDPRDTSADDHELSIYLQSIKDGKLPREIDGDIDFYILGLAPNAARISVRFWHVSTVRDISEKLGQHFRDLEMVRSFEDEPVFPGMWRLLHEIVNKKSKDGPPPLLAGAVMRSIIQGTPYPQTLLSQVIDRIRADQQINYLRAAIIKAVLNRKQRLTHRGMEVSVALDKENLDVAYLLGRLFAVLERAQLDAVPNANATIKDRYFGSASASPRAAFPQLLRLTQHHIQKAEYGRVRDRQIEEIVNEINDFPPHLSLDQQGLFAIGYYHQRRDMYTRKTEDQKEA